MFCSFLTVNVVISEFYCSWSLNADRTVTIRWKLMLLDDAERQGETGPFQNYSCGSFISFFTFFAIVKVKLNGRSWTLVRTRNDSKLPMCLYFLVFRAKVKIFFNVLKWFWTQNVVSFTHYDCHSKYELWVWAATFSSEMSSQRFEF